MLAAAGALAAQHLQMVPPQPVQHAQPEPQQPLRPAQEHIRVRPFIRRRREPVSSLWLTNWEVRGVGGRQDVHTWVCVAGC